MKRSLYRTVKKKKKKNLCVLNLLFDVVTGNILCCLIFSGFLFTNRLPNDCAADQTFDKMDSLEILAYFLTI